jgi:phenylacetate-CoA ligase
MLTEQIAHAYTNAPAIKSMMDAAGVTPDMIQSTDDLRQIPVTSKDKLQEMQQENPPFGGFLAVPIRELKRIFLSPGPIYDPHGQDDEAAHDAATEAFQGAGFTADDIVLNTFLYHMVPAGLLMDEAITSMGAAVVPLGPGNTEIQIKVIMDLQVTAYAGTPSFLEIIYEKAEEMGIPPQHMPIKKAFFSAEPYFPHQRLKFEQEWSLLTAQAYATADLGIIAYEIPGEPGMFIPRNLIVQICDPETGEILPEGSPGEVVVTTMSRVYPLIRFGTGDLSIMETVEFNGEPRQKLLGLLGRSGDAIKVRGMFLHPNALKKAASEFEGIEKMQAVIGRDGARDTLTLHVISSNPNLDTDALAAAVKAAGRLSVDEVKLVDDIEGRRMVRDTRT